jgi:hypothetical protein
MASCLWAWIGSEGCQRRGQELGAVVGVVARPFLEAAIVLPPILVQLAPSSAKIKLIDDFILRTCTIVNKKQ